MAQNTQIYLLNKWIYVCYSKKLETTWWQIKYGHKFFAAPPINGGFISPPLYVVICFDQQIVAEVPAILRPCSFCFFFWNISAIRRSPVWSTVRWQAMAQRRSNSKMWLRPPLTMQLEASWADPLSCAQANGLVNKYMVVITRPQTVE